MSLRKDVVQHFGIASGCDDLLLTAVMKGEVVPVETEQLEQRGLVVVGGQMFSTALWPNSSSAGGMAAGSRQSRDIQALAALVVSAVMRQPFCRGLRSPAGL